MIKVPERLAESVLRDVDGAAEWIDGFPELARGYLERWSCEPDGEVRAGGVAVVIPVRSPYGPAVIKISPPHPGNADEHRALRLWNGSGAVRLHDCDASGFALLLERVTDRTLDVDVDEAVAIGGELSARLAVPAPAGIKRLADTTEEWEQQLHDDHRSAGVELPARVFDAAVETVRDLGRDRTATMLHGDLHEGNILHAERGWVVIDPKGMSGTAAYDALTVCVYRLPASELVAELRRRIMIFSEAAGVDPDLSRRCVQARAVTGLLWDLDRGDVPRTRNYELRLLVSEGLLD
ncbi:aminoglycoside phosphotransferase family protein [Microlunatus sp. GCM10028923]|uniref:aminoglycoside phosphotransferase family protein n=1 Tax=Microlunatus sp. GCM10028923 TaxID=3273400 RepID=UPI003618DF46